MSNKFFLLIILAAITSTVACQNAASNNNNEVVLAPTEFETKISEVKEAVVLDVCTPNEFGQQHIKSAVNINFHSDGFDTHLNQMDKDKPYFVYCWAGSRSTKAAKQMREMGFKQVYELKGGISNWMKQGKLVENNKRGPSTQNLRHFINTAKIL